MTRVRITPKILAAGDHVNRVGSREHGSRLPWVRRRNLGRRDEIGWLRHSAPNHPTKLIRFREDEAPAEDQAGNNLPVWTFDGG